jgi:hypothetical protein
LLVYLSTFFHKFETAQNKLEKGYDADCSNDTQVFEDQHYQIKARFHKLLHAGDSNNALDSSEEHNSSTASATHSSSAHIKLPTIKIPTFSGDACKWLHFRDTFQALIINNNVLPDKKISLPDLSLKGEDNMLIVNLPVT